MSVSDGAKRYRQRHGQTRPGEQPDPAASVDRGRARYARRRGGTGHLVPDVEWSSGEQTRRDRADNV